ncbi:transcriptional regulator with XRE-family HTH domain [Desulfobaculum xiamenense]|uniref:Transcriptional regulator with XRE-family HTH domain n=1 Tax=Desulfobaculum xiamenense TaxID=995050 RepID=A0A846QDN9_9BACT|nr:XRE family transcriptional regulator [Desulfobaculum xiamenense]NJB66421.1 transcriptional regulator with XRE-family HTH domain [Desulfobaculum xiamenense]
MDWSEQFEFIKDKISGHLAENGTAYSLNRAATYLGVGVGKVRAWAGGQRPSADDLEIIGRRLGLSARWLLYREGEAQARPEDVLADGGQPAAPQPDALVQRMETLDRLLRAANAPDEVICAALTKLVASADADAAPHPDLAQSAND